MVGLFADPAVDQPGKVFVITGRNTFSAASMFAARLQGQTHAVFIGEPMSGCPTTYGNNVELPLDHSGLSVLVSSLLEPGVDPNDTRTTIPLDVAAELTQDEWAAGDDPALDLVLVAAP
jgi:C-terminal processing protease CtpA/Prc